MNILSQIYQISLEVIRNHIFFRHQKHNVTILGSARFSDQNENVKKAYQLSQQFAQKGYVILTGGGHGIMEAASQGAFDAGGKVVGCYVKRIESTNAYLTQTLGFHSLMARQAALIQYSEALIVFPGGFGTLAELLAVLVLIQNKQKKTSLFLIGSSFWEPLTTYFRDTLLKNYQTIDPRDLESILITDSIDEVLKHFGSIQTSRQ